MLSEKRLFITTPIFYLNNKPHLGHAYTMIIVDIIARYKKSRGYIVSIQTGSDEHGEKMIKTAEKEELKPLELIEKNLFFFQKLLKKINFSQHFFYRTTSKQHQTQTKEIFKKLLEQEDIYLGKYQGKYCTICEEYVTKGDLQYCLVCKNTLGILEETAYFFQVTKYYSWLKTYYQKFTNFIIPEKLKKSLINNFLSIETKDLCLTRSNLTWGIYLDNNPELTIYVWFDALLNYLNSSEGQRSFKDRKVEIIQIIGKDIARFHCIYWPIILYRLNFRLPDKIIAHGWILNQGIKMSKSKKNVIDPLFIIERYPSDLLRAYLISKITFLEDGSFSEEEMKNFYQTFFINDLGNLVARIGRMVWLYNDGITPCADSCNYQNNILLENYSCLLKKKVSQFFKLMDNQQLTEAFNLIELLVTSSNKLVNDIAPWKTIILDKALVFSFLRQIIGGIRLITLFLDSFTPEFSSRISDFFSFSKKITIDWENCLKLDSVEGLSISKFSVLFNPL